MTAARHEVNHLLSTIPDYIQKVYCDTNKFTVPFKCAVKSCPNMFVEFDQNYPYKFHLFPANKKLRTLWKVKCGWDKYDHMKGLMVCSDHFNLDDYIRNYREEFQNPNFKRRLNSVAIPNLKLGPNQDVLFDVSDDDYDTDIEYPQTVLQNASKVSEIQNKNTITNRLLAGVPKQYHTPGEHIALKEGPINLTEVKREVAINIKLEKRNVELQANMKQTENIINNLMKKIRTTKVRLVSAKRRYQDENKILRRTFSKAQINVLRGKKAIWTDDDLATAFTMRHMGSKKAYLYLKDTLKVPLPALSCVQKWAATRAEDSSDELD